MEVPVQNCVQARSIFCQGVLSVGLVLLTILRLTPSVDANRFAGAFRELPRRRGGGLRGGEHPSVLESGVRRLPDRDQEQVRSRAEGELRRRPPVGAVQEVQGGREAVLRGRPRAGVRARREGRVRVGRAAGEGGAQV